MLRPSNASPGIAPRSRWGLWFLGILSFLGVLGGVGLLFVQLHHRSPDRVILLRTQSPDLDLLATEALTVFLQDHLEALGGPPIGIAVDLPDTEGWLPLGPRTLIVQPVARRVGDQLGLELRTAWSRDLSRGQTLWKAITLPPGEPDRVFEAALRQLPLRLAGTLGASLLPKDPRAFWDLVRAQGWHRVHDRLEEAQGIAEHVLRVDPQAAEAHLVRGDILYRRLLSSPQAFTGSIESAHTSLQPVLDRFPGHPRAVFLLAELHIDAGNQRSALEVLREAQRRNPKAAPIYSGIAYAARTAGLLDVAVRALKRRDRLIPTSLTHYTAENTYLYLGDWKAFRATLVERPGNPRNTVVHFYRGYLVLAEGHREAAREHFERAVALGQGYGEFLRLSEVFRDITNDRREVALANLRRLERDRTGLRVPDGEFTFKMAEAYALLGDREASLDLLSRAFAQGFGCSRWYRESPFLGPVRQALRWRSLLNRVEERERLIASRFTPRTFGL